MNKDKSDSRYSHKEDLLGKWLVNANNLTDEQRKQYRLLIKDSVKEAQIEFNKLESVYSQFEVKNGRAVIKEGSAFTDDQVNMFERRVQQVNHSMHGIYNVMDRAKLRDNLIGDLAFQFRAWMRPNFIRYFGQRFGRSVYNEALGSYRKGAFISLYDFISSPAKLDRTSEELTAGKALYTILGNYAKFFGNMRFAYSTLSLQEQQNVNVFVVTLLI